MKQTTPDSVNHGEWSCELNADFDVFNVPAETNYCACSRSYECVEDEQYSLEELDIDLGDVLTASSELDEDPAVTNAREKVVTDWCQADLAEVTGLTTWNCTLASDGEDPHGRYNQVYCDCRATKQCELHKVLFLNELFNKQQI